MPNGIDGSRSGIAGADSRINSCCCGDRVASCSILQTQQLNLAPDVGDLMAPAHPLSAYHEGLAREDIANQTALAMLRQIDSASAEEWDQKFDGIGKKYADIASRLDEHEVYDPAGLELLDELDREVGQPLFEDPSIDLLQEVAKRPGSVNLGVNCNPHWSVGRDTAFVFNWCPNYWAGKQIIARNRRGDPVPPEEYHECKHSRFPTNNRNCQ